MPSTMQPGLGLLLQVRAHMLGRGYPAEDAAVGLHALQAFGMTEYDLHWLVDQGHIDLVEGRVQWSRGTEG